MRTILALIFGCTLVMYLSASAFAQGKGGGRGPGGPPETGGRIDHGNNTNREESHAKTEPRGDQKSTNFESRIERNPALKSKLESMLPANTTLAAAAKGFKNEGQFIAALHVSKNLNIPFDQLKMKMTGTNAMPLGQAIHSLKPEMSQKDADMEADKAEKEAKVDQKTKAAKPLT